jgi:hypothetical protein
MKRRRKIVFLIRLLLPACLLCSFRLPAQSPGQTGLRQKITLRIVDGITGLPEWFEFPNIWIGASTDSRNPRLNIRGEIQIDVTEVSPREIRFLPNWYADCRYHADEDTGMKVRYAFDEILESGVVGKNVCGWFHAKSQPGVIVFYVRHRTLLEMIAL